MLNRQIAPIHGLVVASSLASGSMLAADWKVSGRDDKNSRYQSEETHISASNVAGLTVKWELTTSGDANANSTVDGDFLYFPDSAGFLYEANKATGVIVWKNPISSDTGITGDLARSAPAVVGDALILGNQSGKFLQAFGQPAPRYGRRRLTRRHCPS